MEQYDRPGPTERLSFGVWQENDANLADAIWGDPIVTELTGGPFTPEAVRQRLAYELENWRSLGIQYWPIFLLSDGALIGSCGLRPREMETRVAELGFQLCRYWWGRGFAFEAAIAVIGWARKHDFRKLIAGHHPENEASKRTLLRLGFSFTHNELYQPTGVVEPCYILSL